MALDSVQYKNIFDLHYEALYGYAFSILREETYTDDILQNIFIKLWQNREAVHPETVKAYLYTSVRNECLNYLKHKGVKANYAQHQMGGGIETDTTIYSEQKELHETIQQLVNQLPEKCATVFYMCRQLGMSYREVAEAMGISVKTVENQVSKALKFLRSGLADYLVSIIPLLMLQLINL